MPHLMTSIAVALRYASTALTAEMPTDKTFTNSIGMQFVRIEPGTFLMGESVTNV
ncbi:hypothetical protein IH992_23855 [Candidatus Poribacteria bacterium]|nr:hypothetical protein [Candidatus Poribacteria bacterium]